MKRCLEDETPIEFIAQVGEDQKVYSLVITCKIPLTEDQYARCLISFAKDIIENRFSFVTAEYVEAQCQ